MNQPMLKVEQLITDKLSGNISESDDLVLAGLLEQDENARLLYQQTLLAYTAYNQHAWQSKKKQAFSWEELNEKLNAGKSDKGVPIPIVPIEESKRSIRPWIAAASVVFVAILGFWIYQYNSGSTVRQKTIRLTLANGETIDIQKNAPGTQKRNELVLNYDSTTLTYTTGKSGLDSRPSTISVPAGMDYHLVMADGTEVWLNAVTDLQFPLQFTGPTREVSLSGEAFFKVAKNAARPFIVHTGQVQIVVTGTSFNIKAYSSEPLQTSLVEGKVTTKTKADSLHLLPGSAARLSANGQLESAGFDPDMVLAWMKGYYFFKDEALSNINFTLERWFSHRFRYKDPSIGTIRFSGALEKDQTLTEFCRRISSSAGLSYTIEGNEVILSRP